MADRSRIHCSMSDAVFSFHVGHGFVNRRRPKKPLTWCAGQPHAMAAYSRAPLAPRARAADAAARPPERGALQASCYVSNAGGAD